ncbi:maltose ABC transporter periplasmic protein [Anaerococcus prevotii]|uniref:carbohydrate ABC transporter substrate-binding protein n=1 Tax=Anaerococcus prevotii TaxID=33034 RepID=UPI00019DDCE1|nr:carbohydrate ABC transporter substrate-binding protein [Anaerococcus prevotii]SUU95359.1 maltose ABC transporter periplasmic protein [Anaerococcus prevotii]
MKKLKTTLLAALAIFAFTACGAKENDGAKKEEAAPANEQTEQKDDSKEEDSSADNSDKKFAGKTLTLAGLDGGYGTEGWKKVIASFEEMTGAKVEAKFEKNIHEVIRPEIQAGNAPDVIYNNIGQESGLTETMIKENMLMDITDVLDMTVPGEDKKVSEKIIPGFTDTAVTNPYGDGKTYLAPLFYSPTGLWYNKAMFKEGGGKYELPKTMDEFIALGEEAKKDGISLFTYPTTGYFDTFSFAMFYSIGGSELFDKLVNYDPEAWKNEATPYFETVGEILKYLNPNTVAQANNESFTQNQLQVMKNESLFMPNGTWIVEEMKDAQGVADNFEWGLMALPSMNEGKRYAYSWFEQIFITESTKEADLAKEFIAYLYSDEASKLFLENGGAVQPINGIEDMITDENQKLFYSIYEDDVTAALGGWGQAPAVEGVDMTKELFDAINSVANGDKSVEDWQKDVVSAAKKISEAVKAQK